MKRAIKILIITVIAVSLALAFTACETDNGDNGKGNDVTFTMEKTSDRSFTVKVDGATWNSDIGVTFIYCFSRNDTQIAWNWVDITRTSDTVVTVEPDPGYNFTDYLDEGVAATIKLTKLDDLGSDFTNAPQGSIFKNGTPSGITYE